MKRDIMEIGAAIHDEYDDHGEEAFHAKTLAQIDALLLDDEARQATREYFEKLTKAETVGHLPTMPLAVNSALNTGINNADPAVGDQFQEVVLRIGLVFQYAQMSIGQERRSPDYYGGRGGKR